MKVSLKLFSHLMEYLPAAAEGNTVQLELSGRPSCNDLLGRYKIPPKEIQVVMLNGDHLSTEKRDDPLSDGDKVSVWPSIQGG